ncbi:hypothetical protein J1614_004443 [Plenodomus biglobosus]|nr:hypothetical protein J1614_004443 [Plenodomus biglobosus]
MLLPPRQQTKSCPSESEATASNSHRDRYSLQCSVPLHIGYKIPPVSVICISNSNKATGIVIQVRPPVLLHSCAHTSTRPDAMTLPQTPIDEKHVTSLPRVSLRKDGNLLNDRATPVTNPRPLLSTHSPKQHKISWSTLHTQDLIDVMLELEPCKDPRAIILFDMAREGRHHALNEEALKPQRDASNGPFDPNIFESPILAGQNLQPFDMMPTVDEVQRILFAEIGAPNFFRFAPTRGSAERDAFAAAELLRNLGYPWYQEPGAIIHMDSPTFGRLRVQYDRWEHIGFLGQSNYKITVAPANEVFELVHHDYHLFSTLLTGCKVWLAFPPHPQNLHVLRTGYEEKWLESSDTAMMNILPGLRHGIFIIQRPGETLLLPPQWSFIIVSTQTSACCEFWRAMATKYVDRLSELHTRLMLNRLWPTNSLEQSHLISYAVELSAHLEHILNGSFKYFNASKVINRLCREWFKSHPEDSEESNLYDTLKPLFIHIQDGELARHLEATFRQSWIALLERQRKKKSECRLCHVRIEVMPGGGNPSERLAQHFVAAHWNA